MTGRYLLDTNILSDNIRNPRGLAARRVRVVGNAQICTSVIVAAELRYGVAKTGCKRLSDRVAEALERLEILPLEPPVDEIYARLRSDLERIGNLVGPNDLLIAAQAMSLDVVIVTGNEREFSRIPGLKVEDWLQPMSR